MKLLIASDIHGSDYYCKLLTEAFAKENADRLLLLGDILYHGPRNDLPRDYNPKAVIAELNSLKDKILAVRGNCDTEVDQMVLEFPMLADYAVLLMSDRTVYATHGHIYNEANLPSLNKGDILLNGHTHISACTVYDDYIYMNPGSVSMPKANTPNGYIIFEDNKFIWKKIRGEEYNSYSL